MPFKGECERSWSYNLLPNPPKATAQQDSEDSEEKEEEEETLHLRQCPLLQRGD